MSSAAIVLKKISASAFFRNDTTTELQARLSCISTSGIELDVSQSVTQYNFHTGFRL